MLINKTEEYKILVAKNIYSNFYLSENFKDLPKENSIIVCNYPSDFLEYFVKWLIPKYSVFVVIKEIGGFMEKIAGIKTLSVKRGGGYEDLKIQIKEAIKHSSIFVYINQPEYRISKKCIGKFRTGMFSIAHELHIPITPIITDVIHQNKGYIPYQNYRIKIGKTEIISNLENYINKIRINYKKNILHFSKNKKII